MKNTVLSKLRCVDCFHDQLNIDYIRSNGGDIREGNLKCGNCGRTYTIVNGIGTLLPLSVSQIYGASNSNKMFENYKHVDLSLKKNEIDYYDTHISPQPDEEQNIFYGTGRSLRRCKRHTDMYNYYLNSICDDIEPMISGKTVLNIGCGAGQESEFLARVCGANIIGLDISQGSIEAAVERSNIFNYSKLFDGIVGDMENLPFQDKSIDVCLTHTSLHHATDPFKVIDEMARVSRDGFVISSESIKSVSIKLALMLGFTEEFEDNESGNKVWRITKKEFQESLNKMGFSDVLIKTHWLNTSMKVRWGKIWGRPIRPITSFLESEFMLRLQDMILRVIGNSIFIRVKLQ